MIVLETSDLISSTSDDHAEMQLYSNWMEDPLPYFWTNYVAWVRDNYVHNIKNPTMGQLVDAHLSEWGLSRVYEHRHCTIVGPQDSLTAWTLTYS